MVKFQHLSILFLLNILNKYFFTIACSDESLEDIWKSNYDDYVYDESLIEPCCTHRWTDKMGHNLKAIMKVMRFAIRRGKICSIFIHLFPTKQFLRNF